MKTLAYKLYIFCNQWIMVAFLLPVVISQFDFSRKILCLSFSVPCIIFTHTPHFATLVCDEDWSSDRSRKKISITNWCFHWDLSSNAQISPLSNSSTKSLSNEPWPRKAVEQRRRDTSKGKSITTAGGIVFPSDLSLIMEETVSAPSQGAAWDIYPSSTYESQL